MYTLHHEGRRAHFLAMPRTASRACCEALKRIGAVCVDGHHQTDKYKRVVQEGDLVISTVRNHWDWFVSFWHLNGCPGNFGRFVPRLCRESRWINRNPTCTECRLFWQYVPLSTVILRYERLKDDLNYTLLTHGFPTVELEQMGDAKPQPYQTYYDDTTREYVQSRFRKEIAKYGYTF